jgi:Zn-dependent protease
MQHFVSLMILRVPAILIALTIHELSHGLVARALGDHTAERAGRLTLNPISHLDLFGTLMLLFGPFGWAKPVPVNPILFSDPKKGMAYVAAAGPLSNIMLAAVTGLFFRFGFVTAHSIAGVFLYILFMINIGLAVFNLLPIYPLDGSRILMAFLKRSQVQKYLKAMTVVPQIFLGMIVAEWLLDIPILSYLLNPIFMPVFQLAKALFIDG